MARLALPKPSTSRVGFRQRNRQSEGGSATNQGYRQSRGGFGTGPRSGLRSRSACWLARSSMLAVAQPSNPSHTYSSISTPQRGQIPRAARNLQPVALPSDPIPSRPAGRSQTRSRGWRRTFRGFTPSHRDCARKGAPTANLVAEEGETCTEGRRSRTSFRSTPSLRRFTSRRKSTVSRTATFSTH